MLSKKLIINDETIMAFKKTKALLLFSGGLDSILAAKVLIDQGIEVVGISFESYFFGVEQAKFYAKKIGVELNIIDISKKHLKKVKSPKYGYGSSMNPCIDCRILMLEEARKYSKSKNFDFIATGEVIGERPMTQNKSILRLTEKESLLSGYLLRPLSAKLLPLTIPEKKGLVNREKLFGISGRSRKIQIDLAKKMGIDEYPSPAGGCLLTETEFGKRLKDLIERYPKCEGTDITILKIGRHFWLSKSLNVKIVIGRNEEENLKIKKIVRKKDILIEMKNYPGPVGLIRSYRKNRKIPQCAVKKTMFLVKNYSTKSREKDDVEFKIFKK